MDVKITLLLFLTTLTAVVVAQSSHNPCPSKQSCSECIRTSTCSWCSKPDMDATKRCFQSNLDIRCPAQDIVNPSIEYRIIKNSVFSKGTRKAIKTSSSSTSASSSSSSSSSSWSSFSNGSISRNASSSFHSDTVQIAPQRVSLKLRINEAHRIKFAYKRAEDYPIDLYYLMDLSKSMEDDKDKLSNLSTVLVKNMQDLTTDFQLGFGSFVDKVVMPYVSTVPKNLEAPCFGCAAPYGFQNVMPLDTDANTFADKVKSAAVSGNLDAPEGGFDAIMQAVVCQKEIGWRDEARRLLVFSTDAGFHYAGDGKLGGIVRPNDGECHLDGTGLYTHSNFQDYPSISQVNQKVKQNKINVIFAVTAEQIGIYDQLRNHVEGSSSGQLSNDSSNVVDLVKDQYNKISSTVEMQDDASQSVQVSYYSSGIEGSGGKMERTNKCEGIKVGSRVNFEAELLVKSCPKDPKEWKQTLKIYPVGIKESLLVELELLCDCPCERKNHPDYEERSSKCSGAGAYTCGVCKCDDHHFGRKCECDSDTVGSKDATDGSTCRPDNITNVDCSGRGNCVCGVCECETRENPEEVVSGTFCECDNFSCNYHNGLLCSGTDHGICECNECKCKAGWKGTACECSDTNLTCIAPGSKEICSGNGECVCGACQCDETEDGGHFTGQFCEKRPVSTKRCAEFRDCVQCQMYQKGVFNDEECAANCTTFVPLPVDHVEADADEDEVLCVFFDDDDCRYRFVYAFNGTEVVIRAQEQLDCPAEVYFLGIILGVIAAIVLIGLALLLLWKLLTTIHDRREFAKFEKERMMAKWDTGENPIYKQATSTFKNPTYAGK